MVFGAMARLCGLSKEDLVAYLGVPARRIDKWVAGSVPASPGALSALRALHDRQQTAADGLIASWIDAGRPEEINYAVAGSSDMARLMGWPCRDAQLVVAAIAQAEIAPARVQARGVRSKEKSQAAEAEEALTKADATSAAPAEGDEEAKTGESAKKATKPSSGDKEAA